jgi:ABC-type Mn2+/Zn2+ transport system ATPase subunit
MSPVTGTITVTEGRRIAYVLQATKVNEALPVTVREVVAMGRYATAGPYRRLGATDRAAVDTALERMRITNLARRHLRNSPAASGGRCSVAQASPRITILLLDGSTGLDLVSAGDRRRHPRRAAVRAHRHHHSHALNEAAARDW